MASGSRTGVDMMNDNLKTFQCTSVKLKKYLINEGLKYINVFINADGWTIWEFPEMPELKHLLKKWEDVKSI